MRSDYRMDFEHCIRQFLGDEAYHIADFANDEIYIRKWLKKCISKSKKQIDKLDTTTRHKEMLMSEIENINSRLKNKNSIGTKELIIDLFWLISRLLGFDGVSGRIYNEPFYYQTYGQYLLEKRSWSNGKDWFDLDRENKTNAIFLRKKVYNTLKDEKISDNQIALVLNTTGYQIKKLKNNL